MFSSRLASLWRLGGDKMSRRRSKDPTTDIRITIPRSIHDKILDVLEPSASRSAWISAACRDKLMDTGMKVADATNLQLLVALVNRGAITLELFEGLKASAILS